MTENTVVKGQLTDEMIDFGAKLTAKLDDMGLPITAAMWWFEPDINEWRLLIASPDRSTAGPREAYRKIEKARKDLRPNAAVLPLSAIDLIKPGNDVLALP